MKPSVTKTYKLETAIKMQIRAAIVEYLDNNDRHLAANQIENLVIEFTNDLAFRLLTMAGMDYTKIDDACKSANESVKQMRQVGIDAIPGLVSDVHPKIK